MSTVSAAGSTPSIFVSLALHTRVRVVPGAASDGSTTPAPVTGTSSSGTSAQDQAFAAFAQAILSILPTGSASDSTATGSGTTAGGTAASGSAGSSTSTPSSPTSTPSPADLAQNIANALGSSGTGDGGPDALLKQIESAIDGASATLVQSGVSADAVKNYASAFRTQLGQALDSIAASLSGPGSSSGTPVVTTSSSSSSSTSTSTSASDSTSGGSASYHLVEKGTIKLALQDGSQVTIRLRNSATINVGGNGQTSGQTSGASAYAQQNSYASSRFSVSVQGSLSQDDLTAINDVLKQVDTLATQFFSGNTADAFASGAALHVDPNEIARVSIRLSETESLRVTGPLAAPVSTPTVPTGTAGTPAIPTSPSVPATPSLPVVTGTSDGSTPATDGSTTPSDPTTPVGPVTTGTTADPTTSTSAASGGTTSPSSSLLDALYAYIKDVIATLGTTTQSGSVTISAKAKLDLLAGAVVGASLTVRESSAAGFFKRVTDATTDASTGAATAAS